MSIVYTVSQKQRLVELNIPEEELLREFDDVK